MIIIGANGFLGSYLSYKYPYALDVVSNTDTKISINQINYFAFLSNPKETKSKLVLTAEANNIDVGLFKY